MATAVRGLDWRNDDGLHVADLADGRVIVAERADGLQLPFVVLRSPGEAGVVLLGPAGPLDQVQRWAADGAVTGVWPGAEWHYAEPGESGSER